MHEINSGEYDAVLVLLGGHSQLEFLSQTQYLTKRQPIFALPDLITQTREAYRFIAETAPRLAAQPRFALWDGSLSNSLNERYAGRFGIPLDSSGWLAYAAIELALRLHAHAESAPPGELASKSGLCFSEGGVGLIQPIYQVQVNAVPSSRGTPDSQLLSNLVARAEVVGTVQPTASGTCAY